MSNLLHPRFVALLLWIGVFCPIAHPLRAGTTIEFYASNNKGEIDPPLAFQRLIGQPQVHLHKRFTRTLQHFSIEHGKFKDILGAYQESNQHLTADNTLSFRGSPDQLIPKPTAFLIAQELAQALKQDSVAVFIPTLKPVIGEVIVTFKSAETQTQPTIAELTQILRDRLPLSYSQSFSLSI